MTITNLNLHSDLKKAFIELGFSELTDIQRKAIPLILEGKDVIGQSQTGSGKTAAFGFPILDKIVHNGGIQSLVLVPTRELCEQVTIELRKFSKYKKVSIVPVYGGVSIENQIHNLKHADLVVATPGRMLDHISRRTIKLENVKILILDEADKMFEMGFIDDVKNIIYKIPKEHQTLLFSATMSNEVHEIVTHYMKHPEKIKVQSYVDEAKLAQYYYSIDSRMKFSLLVHILKQEQHGLTIIFCATRDRVDAIERDLYGLGIKSRALHGGLSQNRRKEAIELFHGNKIKILVASDVAARGLDIKNVECIINYDLPKTSKEYIHRIGRTARAGKEGKVISLLSEFDHDNFRMILRDDSLNIQKLEVPEIERVRTAPRQFKPRTHKPKAGVRHVHKTRYRGDKPNFNRKNKNSTSPRRYNRSFSR